MDACPACTASTRDANLHCTSPGCVWLICGKCRSRINNDTGTYYGKTIWGNPAGYIKAD
jgi:hypothetical protein